MPQSQAVPYGQLFLMMLSRGQVLLPALEKKDTDGLERAWRSVEQEACLDESGENNAWKFFGAVPGLFRTVQLNCSAWTANRPAIAYGCTPQVVLAVVHNVIPPHEVPTSMPPALPDTSTLVVAGTMVVPEEQATPTCPLPVMVERASDFGVVAFWTKIPPKMKLYEFGPLLLTVVFWMSKPAPSSRMPPAVLSLTLTWERRTTAPLSAHKPGEPAVMERLRT